MTMRIVIGNIPEDSTVDSLREALSAFAPAEAITIVTEGETPTAVIEMVMTRDKANALVKRIQGRIYRGRALTAWVPAMGWE
jgi:RNA recognition motif-containing protein